MPHLRRSFLAPPELEEPFAAELWAAGTLGVEMRGGPDGRVCLAAYFAAGAPAVDLAGWDGVELAGEEIVPDTDWFAAYRLTAQPFAIGRTLTVDPREPEDSLTAAPDGRRLLRLPARGAFGIGSHESTRLALEILEDLDPVDLAGRDVLDVGTGTGILAFAALGAGARTAVAYDNDPAAPFYARDNARRNGFAPRLFAGPVAALAPGARFDLALANVIPEQILPDLAALAGHLKADGGIILSGILAERGDEMLAAAAGLGFAERARRIDGEWIAFHVARSAPR